MPFTKDEMAALLGKSIRQVERYNRLGILNPLKINPARGGRVIYSDAEVERIRNLGFATA